MEGPPALPQSCLQPGKSGLIVFVFNMRSGIADLTELTSFRLGQTTEIQEFQAQSWDMLLSGQLQGNCCEFAALTFQRMEREAQLNAKKSREVALPLALMAASARVCWNCLKLGK